MNIPREKIEHEVSWFNGEVQKFKDLLVTWLRELGHKVEISEEKLEKVEELGREFRGQYTYFYSSFDLEPGLSGCNARLMTCSMLLINPFPQWPAGQCC